MAELVRLYQLDGWELIGCSPTRSVLSKGNRMIELLATNPRGNPTIEVRGL